MGTKHDVKSRKIESNKPSNKSVGGRTMSITRALATLKRLHSDIVKFSENDGVLSYVYSVKHKVEMMIHPSGYSLDEASSLIKSNTSSILDKIKEYHKIKVAIAEANIKTYTTFKGEKYSLYSLMVYKDLVDSEINVYQEILKSYKRSNEFMQSSLDKQNTYLEERRADMVKANKSSGEIDKFINSERVEFKMESVMKVETVLSKIDELKVVKSEIDVLLSEINATTMISY